MGELRTHLLSRVTFTWHTQLPLDHNFLVFTHLLILDGPPPLPAYVHSGAYTGVCSHQHVPGYKNNIDKFKAKGIDSVVCVAVNDPFTLNAWAEKLQAKDVIEFYGDFDGSFHKSLDLGKDLSAALLGPRSERWSAYVDDGKIKAFNVEEAPSEVKVSGAEVILGQI